ncbi:hypothetical protein K501DRAFT_277052 [Backusella circina FSU 941]|nr:hypothetical protein K501DRAFT_277052 [Backusella circina FSU 941]
MDEAEPIVNESPVLHESIGEEQLLESTVDSEEDILSGDILGRRIRFLVSVMRSLLFSRKVTYTSPELKNKMLSITDAEATLCGKLCEICPLHSVTSLSAYALDTVMLFNMFCSNSDKGIEIYDYKGEAITSGNELCDSHGLNFIHHLHILPGAKTVRIIGALKKTSVYQRVTIIGSPKIKDQDPRITPEMELSKDDLKSNIKVLDAEISALEHIRNEIQTISERKLKKRRRSGRHQILAQIV